MNAPRFRTTVWPGYVVEVPPVDVPDSVELDGEWLVFETSSPYGEYRELPPELYLRQVRDLDLDDLKAVADFVRKYGRCTGVDLMQDLPGNNRENWAHTFSRFSSQRERRYERLKMQHHPFMRVHVDEVVYRLTVLRALTAHAIAFRGGEYEHKVWPDWAEWPKLLDPTMEAWRRFTDYTNAALSTFHVRLWVDLGDPDFDVGRLHPNVYEAAVLQLVNDLVEEVDYLRCPHCGRTFARQVGRSTHHSRLQGLKFCSAECGRRASVKAYRARKRAEKKGSDNG